MYCPNCGHQLPDAAVFCPNCGQKIEEKPSIDTQINIPSIKATEMFTQASVSESPKRSAQKKIRLSWVIGAGGALLIGIVLLLSFSHHKDTPPASTDTAPEASSTEAGRSPEDTYAPILTQYSAAIQEHWNQARLEEAGLNDQCFYYTDLSEIGYIYSDIDHNGTTELLIGEVGANGGGVGYFLDLYTIVKDQPHLAATSGERDLYCLCTDGIISNESSSGADSTIFSYYSIGPDGNLLLSEAILFDSSADPKHPWFHTSAPDLSTTTSVSEEEASTIMKKHTPTVLSFIPLSDLPPAGSVSLHEMERGEMRDPDESSDAIFDPGDYDSLCPSFDPNNTEFMYDDQYVWDETYLAWIPVNFVGKPQEIETYLKQCQDIWAETDGKGYSDPTPTDPEINPESNSKSIRDEVRGDAFIAVNSVMTDTKNSDLIAAFRLRTSRVDETAGTIKVTIPIDIWYDPAGGTDDLWTAVVIYDATTGECISLNIN